MKKKKISHRLWAMLLVFIMMFSFIPPNAFAAGENPLEDVTLWFYLENPQKMDYGVVDSNAFSIEDRNIEVPMQRVTVTSDDVEKINKLFEDYEGIRAEMSEGVTAAHVLVKAMEKMYGGSIYNGQDPHYIFTYIKWNEDGSIAEIEGKTAQGLYQQDLGSNRFYALSDLNCIVGDTKSSREHTKPMEISLTPESGILRMSKYATRGNKATTTEDQLFAETIAPPSRMSVITITSFPEKNIYHRLGVEAGESFTEKVATYSFNDSNSSLNNINRYTSGPFIDVYREIGGKTVKMDEAPFTATFNPANPVDGTADMTITTRDGVEEGLYYIRVSSQKATGPTQALNPSDYLVVEVTSTGQVNKDALQAAIDESPDPETDTDYYQMEDRWNGIDYLGKEGSFWSAYLNQRNSAQSLMTSEDVTQSEIDNSVRTLKASVSKLIAKENVNATGLYESYKYAEGKYTDSSLYTEESWAVFEASRQEAKDILASLYSEGEPTEINRSSYQAEVDAQQSDLDNAREKLQALSADTVEVNISIYDYTASTAGLAGASEKGQLLKANLQVEKEAKAIDAIKNALEEASLNYKEDDDGNVIQIGDLSAPAKDYPHSSWFFALNGDFSNEGLKGQAIQEGDRLELHYSLEGQGVDVGRYIKDGPAVQKIRLGGVDTFISSRIEEGETQYYLGEYKEGEDNERLKGKGTEDSPYEIPIKLFTDTDRSGLAAEIETTLHPVYRHFATGEGLIDITKSADYSEDVIFCLETPGGHHKSYYKVRTHLEDDLYNIKVFARTSSRDKDINIKIFETEGFDQEGFDIPGEEVDLKDLGFADGMRPSHQYTMSVPAGTYSFRGTDEEGNDLGGMTFDVPTEMNVDGTSGGKENEVHLLVAEIKAEKPSGASVPPGLKDPAQEDYSVKIFDGEGKQATSGSYGTVMGWQEGYRTLIYGNGNAELYSFYLIPSEEYAAANHVTTRVDSNIAILNPASKNNYTHNVALPLLRQTTIHAPEGAKVQIFQQHRNFNGEEIPAADSRANGDGTVSHTFDLAAGIGSGYTYRVSMEGKITRAGYLGSLAKEIDVAFGDKEDPKTRTGSEDAEDEGSIMMNINEHNVLQLDKGESFRLRAYRGAWQIVDDYSTNIMIEPDMHCTVLSGQDILSIDPVTKGNGNARGNWLDIKALKEGTAVVEITYDAIEVFRSNGTLDRLYSAVNPDRTGLFVVQVGGEGSRNIDFGIKSLGDLWDAEYDTLYFTGDRGELTLAPTADSGEIDRVEISSDKGQTYRPVEGEAGQYKASIAPGNNIVKVVSGDTTDYTLIRGKQLEPVIDNLTHPGEPLQVGDKAYVYFKGLHLPIPKFAGIYNPGYAAPAFPTDPAKDASHHIRYNFPEGVNLEKYRVAQYHFIEPERNGFEVTFDKAGEYTFDGGHISFSVLGVKDPIGYHRTLTDNGIGANFNASRSYHKRALLPDITVKVEDTAHFDIDFQGQPDHAQILLKDQSDQILEPKEGKDSSYSLSYGKYSYEIFCEGYHVYRDAFKVSASGETSRTIQVSMTKATAETWDGSSSAEPEMEEGVYQIHTATELKWLADAVNEGNGDLKAQLQSDIDLGNHSWTAIGSREKPFRGAFDGSGHKIKNLYMNSKKDHQGFFGYVEDGIIEKLTAEGSVNGTGSYYGGIVGFVKGSNARLEYLVNKVRVEFSRGGSLGGIAGGAKGGVTIAHCANHGDILSTASDNAGGIAGNLLGSTIINSYNTATVSASSNVGGIVGRMDGGASTVKNVYNIGDIQPSWDGGFDYNGAVIGYIASNSSGEYNSVVDNAYYLKGTYGQGSAETFVHDRMPTYNIAEKTSAEMKAAQFAEELNAGNDTPVFATDVHGVNGGYPVLKAVDDGSDEAAAKAVEALIAQISDPVSLADAQAIAEARAAYENLSQEQKERVPNLDKLEAAEKALADLEAAKTVEDKISAIGEVTLESKEAIEEARAAYEELSEVQKELVPNHGTLIEAEEAYKALTSDKSDEERAKEVDDLIDLIGDPVTLEDAEKIQRARAAYAYLTEEQQKLVTKLEELEAAERSLKELEEEKDQDAADQVIKAIDELPADISLKDKEQVAKVRQAYNALSQEQKELVSNEEKLISAENTIQELEQEAEKVAEQIDALPKDITLKDKEQVEKVRKAYEALSKEQRALISNEDKLKEAEGKIKQLEEDKVAADKVIDLIHALPDKITLADKEKVEEALAAYNELTEEQKASVDNINKLIEAKEEIARLEKDPGKDPGEDPKDPGEDPKEPGKDPGKEPKDPGKDPSKGPGKDSGKDPSKGSKNTKTGDTFSPIHWISILGLSAVGVFVIRRKKKKTA